MMKTILKYFLFVMVLVVSSCDERIIGFDMFTVSVRSDGNGSVAIYGTYDKSLDLWNGSELTVIATTAANYDFLGWFVGDSEEPVSTEATYRFTVNESVALVAKFERREPINANGYDYVDLGLPSGLMWAAYNVGATKPEEYGGYYAWGETEEKSNYNLNTYKWGSYYTITKYCISSKHGTVDNKTVLDPEDDVVHVNWGGDWRMPTKEEMQELVDYCTWEWTSLNGVNGYRVRSRNNSNSIFLPAGASKYGNEVDGCGEWGDYWTSSLYNEESWSGSGYFLSFNSAKHSLSACDRIRGLLVRPVCK